MKYKIIEQTVTNFWGSQSRIFTPKRKDFVFGWVSMIPVDIFGKPIKRFTSMEEAQQYIDDLEKLDTRTTPIKDKSREYIYETKKGKTKTIVLDLATIIFLIVFIFGWYIALPQLLF